MSRTADQIARVTALPSLMGRHVMPTLANQQYVVHPWIQLLEQKIVTMLHRPGVEIIIVSVPPQEGKALAVETPIPTPTGWKRMGDIVAGDRVIGHDGRAVNVVAAHDPYMSELWRVTFEDGSEILADGQHRWAAITRDVAAYRQAGQAWTDAWPEVASVVTTEEMAATQNRPDNGARWRIPVGRIESDDVDLPLDPYLLGYWLGDGTTTEPAITAHVDDTPELVERIESSGERVSVRNRGTTNTVRVLAARGRFTDLGLLGHKHIPDIYLRSGTDQRRRLFAGLMDSDGGMSGKTAEIAQQSKELAADIHQLASSLGCVVRSSERPSRLNGVNTGATYYRSKITSTFNPFLLKRKAARWDEVATRARLSQRSQRTISSIERTGVISEVRCITVDDPHSVYLAGESMIPTHNSTYCSMLLPAWYLGRNPGHQVILVSYNETQASKWGLRTRNLIRLFGRDLFNVGVDSMSDAASNWQLDTGFGGMMSAGIRGGITGNPGHLIILDDTLKGAEEANSPTIKQKNIEEWDDSVTSRFQENTKVIIPATRWAEDDLSGHLIEQASQPGYSGFPVHVINIKALAEPDPEELREMDPEQLAAWRDPLGRTYGEGLSGQHSQKFFEIKKASTPIGRWMALHQGTPTAGTGGMFPDEDWRYWVYDDHPDRNMEDAVLPEMVKRVRVWDIASSEGAGDWTVGTLVGKAADGRFFILERERFRHAPGGVKTKIVATAERDGFETTILIEQERSGAGPTVLDTYQQLLLGYSVKPAKAEGDKESRATPYSILQNDHKVFLPRDASWHPEWRKEHEQMDGKGKRPKHDDQIDTGAYGVRFLLAGGESSLWDPSAINPTDDMTPEEQMEVLAIRQLLGV